MAGFNDIIYRLQSVGLYDSILPFFLIFVIVFAVLQKSKILHASDTDKKGRSYDVVISLIIGLLVVVPHVLGLYPAGADVVLIMNKALPNVAMILVGLLALFLIVGLFGGGAKWAGKLTGWIALIALGLVIYIFGSAAGWFVTTSNWFGWLNNPETQALIMVIAVFAGVIWFITKDPDSKGPGAGKVLGDVGEEVGKLFGK